MPSLSTQLMALDNWSAIISRIIPSFPVRISITSDAAPEDLMACIAENVVTAPRRLLVFPPKRTVNKKYYGRVDSGSFEISPYLPIRHGGYLLTIRGSVAPFNRGSRILVTLRARAWSLVVFPLFAAEFLIVRSGADSPWIIPGFWIFYHTLGCLLCWLQERWLRRDLHICTRNGLSA